MTSIKWFLKGEGFYRYKYIWLISAKYFPVMQFIVSFHKVGIRKTSKQKIDSVHLEVCMSNLVVRVSVLNPDLPSVNI